MKLYLSTLFLSILGLAVLTSCTSSFQPPVSAFPPPPPAGCGNMQAVTVVDRDPNYTLAYNANPFYVIRSQSDWNAYCSDYNPIPPAPVDFTKDMLLVFSKSYPNPCNSDFFEFKDVCFFPSSIEASYEFRSGNLTMNCQNGSCLAVLILYDLTRAVIVPQSTLPVTWAVHDHCPTPTPVPAPPSSGIHWGDCSVYVDSPGTCAAQLALSVNGAAETTAQVHLISPDVAGGDLAILNYSYSSGPYAIYTGYLNYFPQSTQFFRVDADTSIGSSTCELADPGAPAIDPSGNLVTWNPEGDTDWVRVWGYRHETVLFDSRVSSADALSPFAIPGTAYPLAGDRYRVEAETANVTNNVTGATPTSVFRVYHLQQLDIQK